MPVLKNARHERFAQELAKGKTADEAYVIAGYVENRKNAARLKANEGIRARIEEILARVAEKAEWSAADRLATLKEIVDASKQVDHRAAIAAIAEANKMQGSHAPAKTEIAGNADAPIIHKIVREFVNSPHKDK